MNDEFCSSCGRLEKECICNSKEFCLSDKIQEEGGWGEAIDILNIKDVKEFIRLLKERFEIELPPITSTFVNLHIDKLAGSKLL